MTDEELKKLLCQSDKTFMECVREIYEKGRQDGIKEANNNVKK